MLLIKSAAQPSNHWAPRAYTAHFIKVATVVLFFRNSAISLTIWVPRTSARLKAGTNGAARCPDRRAALCLASASGPGRPLSRLTRFSWCVWRSREGEKARERYMLAKMPKSIFRLGKEESLLEALAEL